MTEPYTSFDAMPWISPEIQKHAARLLEERTLEKLMEDFPETRPVGKATDKQEGGAHYTFQSIQPIDYIYENQLGYMEGNVIKYVTRHKYKNGAEDLRKAIHYLEMLLEKEYP